MKQYCIELKIEKQIKKIIIPFPTPNTIIEMILSFSVIIFPASDFFYEINYCKLLIAIA